MNGTRATRTGAAAGGPILAAIIAAVAGLALACGPSGPPDDLALAVEPADTADPVTSGASLSATTSAGDASTARSALDRAIDDLGTDYRFAVKMTIDGEDTVSVTGHRSGRARAFDLSVAGVDIQAVARDGNLWTRPVGEDEWTVDTWSDDADPLAPLREPLQVSTADDGSGLVTIYDADALGFGADETIAVAVTVAQGEIRFTADHDRFGLVSTLTADRALPPIVAPR